MPVEFENQGKNVRSQATRFGAWLALILSLWATGLRAEALTESQHAMAQSIKTLLETNLYTFSADVQRHYSERLYRMTGKSLYLPPMMGYVMTVGHQLEQDAERYKDAAYRKRRTEALLGHESATCLNLGKSEVRRELLRRWGDLAFSLEVLCRVNIVRSYGVLGSGWFDHQEAWIDIVDDPRIAEFVVDPEVIRIYGAQAATFVYYLLDLGVRDQVAAFAAALRREVNGERPGSQPFDFTLRIYSLTHLVLAASRFYQQPVSRAEFAWVYDDFDRNLDAIINDTRPDVIAEVGICYALAGEADTPTVARLRKALERSFRPEINMIPAVDGTHRLQQGEHRNVLALMLLTWPQKLHPGPNLPDFEVWRELQPVVQ
ncbi:MAG: DUF3541 domain-containing protein [Hahellaceae bacterium]|jgi:hypothetical protein|nr:DUF3541 domain-containing protein [Hahellaceae bacterium]